MKNSISLIPVIKRNKENFIVILSMAIMSFLFMLESLLHPWVGGNTSTDSSVFKTVAIMMEKGYMPYRDSLDHKGPLLYILNWIGNKISPYRGMFITGTFFMSYKISRLKCNSKSAMLVTMFSFSLLFQYFEREIYRKNMQ